MDKAGSYQINLNPSLYPSEQASPLGSLLSSEFMLAYRLEPTKIYCVEY
jgi:hypothetical protein